MNDVSEDSLVTVYIPTRNRIALLLRALESVLEQDYPNVEILVVDDASTDQTAEVLAQHHARDRIRVSRLVEPGGPSAARNLAIQLARGKYITGLDDDDTFLPTRLSELLRTYCEGQWSCVASNSIERYASYEIIRTIDTGIITHNAILHYNKIGNQVLTETNRLRMIGGFDTNLPPIEDYDTWIRLIDRYGPARKIRHASYVAYLSHGSTRISDNEDKVRRGFERLRAKHSSRYKPEHFKTMRLLDHAIGGTQLDAVELVRNINASNYKMALPLFVNSNPRFRFLKQLLLKIRSKPTD